MPICHQWTLEEVCLEHLTLKPLWHRAESTRWQDIKLQAMMPHESFDLVHEDIIAYCRGYPGLYSI